MSGAVPAELGSLSNLTRLYLGDNQLSGAIPPELGSLSNLTRLELGGNELSGAIPAEFGDLSNLERLGLGGNQLTGSIPHSFTSLTSLRSFYFSDNAGLCAPTDDAFLAWLQGIEGVDGHPCDFAADRAVLLRLYDATDGANWEDSSNWLSDRPMESWYGVATDDKGRVGGLKLIKNELSGQIPIQLGNLSRLEWLLLEDNRLSGEMPAELGNLSNLTELRLWGNRLSGAIPAELGDLSNLTVLYLSGNLLTGCIPAALQSVVSNDLDELGLPFCGIPTVVITVDSANYQVRINLPIPVTATFNEPVNGFAVSDVTVANGSAGNFVGSDGDSVYTFDVTPNAVGVVTVDIAAGVAEDSDSNGNTAAVQLTLGLPYDDDHDGAISREEVITAIGDYLFGGLLTRAEVIQIIGRYLFG